MRKIALSTINLQSHSAFLCKIKFKLHDCWLWLGCTDRDGYGQFVMDKRQHKAHRFSYAIFFGECPEDLLIRHICNNPSCVNPHHLVPGNPKDNANDMTSALRQSRGEKHYAAKLSKRDIEDICHLLARGEPKLRVASRYNIGRKVIAQISKLEIWREEIPGWFKILVKSGNLIKVKTGRRKS